MNKKVSKLGLMTMSVGGMVGWGAFMQPGLKFLPTGLLNSIIGMFLGLIMVGTIASCYGIILSKSSNSTGGEYSYSKLAFNKKHNFIVGWFLLIVFIGIAALNTTSFALITKNAIFPDRDFITLYTVAGSPVTLGEIIISVLVISTFSYFMLKGIDAVVTVQNIVTIILLVIVVSLFFLTFINLDIAATPLMTHLDPKNFNLSGIISILVITPWAYYGVSSIPKVASDSKLEYKQVIRITILSLICGFLIYQMLLLLTATIFSQLDLTDYNGWATGDAIKKLYGTYGLFFITAGLGFAIFSGINSFYMGATRVMNSMSEDGLLSKKFSEKHKKYGTPYRSILFIYILIVVTPFFGRKVLGWIVDMSALGGTIVFFYTSITAYKISTGVKKIIGMIATIFSSIFILLLIIPGSPGFLSRQSIVALILWFLLGSSFYLISARKTKTVINKRNILKI